MYLFGYLFEHFRKRIGKKSGALACARLVTKKMGLPVTKLYISKYFDQIDRGKVRIYFQYLQTFVFSY